MRHRSRAHFVVWASAILSISSAEKSLAKENSGHVHIVQINAIEKAYYPREGGYCDNTPPELLQLPQTLTKCCEVNFSGMHAETCLLKSQSILSSTKVPEQAMSSSTPMVVLPERKLQSVNQGIETQEPSPKDDEDVKQVVSPEEIAYNGEDDRDMKSSVINIFASITSILPGDLTDCLDPTNVTDKSCGDSLASVASVMRHSKTRGDGPSFYFPYLDRESKFVQMHPEGWGVNRLVSNDYFGWDRFFGSSSLFSDEDRLSSTNLLSQNFRPIITNVVSPSTSMWSEYIEHIHIDEETGASFINIREDSQPGTTPAVESMVAALNYIARVNKNNGCHQNNEGVLFETDEGAMPPCLIPIVQIYGNNDGKWEQACLEAARNHPSPPSVFVYMRGSENSSRLVSNQTLVVAIDYSRTTLSHLHVEFDQSERAVTNYTLNTIKLEDLPLEYKDDDYINDMKYLRTLADEARGNDLVVGTSGFMPMTTSIIRSDLRMCMGGECPIGNLFADALRWTSDADFAVLSSGGLRGDGWPAGEVHVSDIWAALPFINQLCTGVMSGISVFRLLNYSTSVTTFESTYTKMGDNLLQMSGMKMTYNTLLNGTGSGRLISVEVYDRQNNTYLPLERLKLYKFATDNWMCNDFGQYPSLLGSELSILGEIPGTVAKSTPIQDIVIAYLTDLGTIYDTSIRGSHTNNTQAFEPMALAFIQTAESCLSDQFWEAKTMTCKPCPTGEYVKFSEDLVSFSITPDLSEVSGKNVLSNRELFNVTLAHKQMPAWVVLKESSNNLFKRSTVLQPGEPIAFDFYIDASALGKGTARSPVSFGVILDGDYQGCRTNLDITFETVVEVRSEENFNHLGYIRAVGLTLMALAMALAIFFSAWTVINKRHRIVSLSQPIFLHIICAGTFVMASSIMPLSIDDSITSVQGCNIACMAIPWLLSLGFAITFSALFAKIWRIKTVISNAQHMRRVVVSARDAMKPIALVLTLNFLILLCWTLIDPLRWNREEINDDPTNTHGFCKSEGNASIAFLSLLVLVDGAALILACVQAYQARKLDDEYAESHWIGVACASWIQVMAVGIPVILLTGNQSIAQYFTFSALVFLVCVSMLLLLFVPKMRLMSKQNTQQNSPPTVYQPKPSTTLHHNEEELKRRIQELEKERTRERSRIRELESVLREERDAGATSATMMETPVIEGEVESNGDASVETEDDQTFQTAHDRESNLTFQTAHDRESNFGNFDIYNV